jgi:hypothetical protein
VWQLPESPEAPETVRTVRVRLPGPASAGAVVLHRVTTGENDVLAHWRELGSPAYPTPGQLDALRAANVLTPATGALRIEQDGEGWYARFELRCPGIALLEIR